MYMLKGKNVIYMSLFLSPESGTSRTWDKTIELVKTSPGRLSGNPSGYLGFYLYALYGNV